MNYYNFVNTILETAKSHKLVYEVGEGDIYEHLNSGDHKYPCVFLTVQNVDSNGTQMTVTGSLFYVDALLSDTSNKLQIQSTGMTTLQQIFMRLMDNYPDFDLRTGRYTPFDEKFADLCAGVFSNFTISFMDDTCVVNDDIFEGDVPITPEPEGKYMTITVDSNAGETIIHPNITGNLPNLNLQYRVNEGNWNDFIFGQTNAIHVVAGDAVQWKGNNPDGVSVDYENYLNFSISGNTVALSGNVMSLIDGVGETTVIPNDWCFKNLFRDDNIKTVSPDFLPATTLKTSCYENMFNSCTELTTTPALPATDLTEHCYLGMFYGCTSLTTAPELPATVMALGCYNSMFKGCTSLTTAPELPATQLYIGCYSEMFMCCTSLVTAPELPAITLESQCYFLMFKGCTSLNYVKCLAVERINNPMVLDDWLLNVAPTGTFVKKYGVEFLQNSPSGIPQGWTIEEIDAPIPVEEKYLTITVDSNAGETVIEPNVSGSIGNISRNLQYRLNGGDWTDYVFGQTGEIRVFAGDVVQLKGNNPDGLSVNDDNRIMIYIYDKKAHLNGKRPLHGNVHLSGNVMSLIDGVGETTVIPNDYCFDRLFGNSDISTVSKDFLPATELKPYCYQYMFYECETMTNSPELPATVMKHRCYGNMFYLCFSLVDAPALPATTLAEGCYLQMFRGCTSLEIAPELPAMTLYNYCYDAMFFNCEKLKHAPVLNSNVMKTYCYEAMFYGCKSLVTAPALPATELAPTCYSRMFWGCTSLVNVPEILPATTISYQCYSSMFENCTSLVKAPVLPATTLADGCYTSIFSGCYNLNYVKCLAIDGTSSGNTRNWLSGVAQTGTFVKPSGVSYETGSSGIPDGWTIEEI